MRYHEYHQILNSIQFKKVYNKIVSLIWSYVEMNLNFDDRTINPLGFQIKSYSIANDVDA